MREEPFYRYAVAREGSGGNVYVGNALGGLVAVGAASANLALYRIAAR
jgi:hypothetical protein